MAGLILLAVLVVAAVVGIVVDEARRKAGMR